MIAKVWARKIGEREKSAKNLGARKIKERGSANAKARNLRPKKERESASAKSSAKEREMHARSVKKARAQLCCYVTVNKPVLSYLLSRLLPQMQLIWYNQYIYSNNEWKSHLHGPLVQKRLRYKSRISRHVILENWAMCQSLLPPDLVWGLAVLPKGPPQPKCDLF